MLAILVAFGGGAVIGVITGALIWRHNAFTLTQDAQKVQAAAGAIQKL